MTQEQQLAIRCACADLIGAMESKENPENHDWKAHKQTIKELIKTFPFLKDFTSTLKNI
jgi:hypothetical protein